LNIAAVALWTVGVFAALYAGYLHPQFRVTAGTLSSLVNGVATIFMFVLIDPQLSVMTDDVVDGKLNEPCFRRAIVRLVGSRCAGTPGSFGSGCGVDRLCCGTDMRTPPTNPALNRTAAGELVPDSSDRERRCRLPWC
jgi:hypothetical protein